LFVGNNPDLLHLRTVPKSATFFSDEERRRSDPAIDRPTACSANGNDPWLGFVSILERVGISRYLNLAMPLHQAAEMKIRYTLQEASLFMDEPRNEPYRWT
jgi:hypothetical protein